MTEALPKYEPRIFMQNTLDESKNIILMPEVGLSTEERWERETEWLKERISFTPGLVIDYGCGIGRMAKVIDNPVLGIDISPTMRAFAPDYVGKVDFAVTHPFFLRHMVTHGLRVNGALSIWCLQHCLELDRDCRLLFDALEPGAVLWTLNAPRRYVPVTTDDKFFWADDGKSVDAVLYETGFTFDDSYHVPTDLCQEGSVLARWIRW